MSMGVPRGCQREWGTLKGNNHRDQKHQGGMSEGGIGVYQKGNAEGKPRWAWGCFVLKIKPDYRAACF